MPSLLEHVEKLRLAWGERPVERRHADRQVELRRTAVGSQWGVLVAIGVVVAAVLYFASDDSGYTSGAELLIDGGAMAQ